MTQSTVIQQSIEANGLSDLSKFANISHRNFEKSAQNAIQYARDVGETLREIKNRLPHGSFEKWMERNLEFKSGMARMYMRVYERWDEIQAIQSTEEKIGMARAVRSLPSRRSKPPSEDSPMESYHKKIMALEVPDLGEENQDALNAILDARSLLIQKITEACESSQ